MKKFTFLCLALVLSVMSFTASALSVTVKTNNVDATVFAYRLVSFVQPLTGESTTFTTYTYNGKEYALAGNYNWMVSAASGHELESVKIITAAGDVTNLEITDATAWLTCGTVAALDGCTIDVTIAGGDDPVVPAKTFSLTVNGGAEAKFTGSLGTQTGWSYAWTDFTLAAGTQEIEFIEGTHKMVRLKANDMEDIALSSVTVNGEEQVIGISGCQFAPTEGAQVVLTYTAPVVIPDEYTVTITGETGAIKNLKIGTSFATRTEGDVYTVAEGQAMQINLNTTAYSNLAVTANGEALEIIGVTSKYVKFTPTEDTEVVISAGAPATFAITINIDDPEAVTFYSPNATSEANKLTLTAGANTVNVKENQASVVFVPNAGYRWVSSSCTAQDDNCASYFNLKAGNTITVTTAELVFDQLLHVYVDPCETAAAVRFMNVGALELPAGRTSRVELAEGWNEVTFDACMLPVNVVSVEYDASQIFFNEEELLASEDNEAIQVTEEMYEEGNSVLKIYSGRLNVMPVNVTITVKDGVEHVVTYDKVRKPVFEVLEEATPATLDPTKPEYSTLVSTFAVIPPAEFSLTSLNMGNKLKFTVNGAEQEFVEDGVHAFTVTDEHAAEGLVFELSNKVNTGLENIAIDADAAVEYFNLQGIRVANPENGTFIRRQGTNVSKVYVK